MRRFLLFFFALLGLTGCEKLKNFGAGKEVTPVFGTAPPPRVADLRNPARDDTGIPSRTSFPANDRIQHVEGPGREPRDPSRQFAGSAVMAMVDGTPIFASEILDPYPGLMAQARKESRGNEETLRSVRESVVRRDLPVHIRSRLLVNAFQASLPEKEKSLKKLNEHINLFFEEWVEKKKKQLNVDTRYEVEQIFAKEGTSLAAQRDLFANQQMAKSFFDAKKQTSKIFGRPELMRYYRDHIADYKKHARVRWQEIEVSYAKHGGRNGAAAFVDKAVAALKRGADFGSVAREYSDAATAAQGGQEDWLQFGSLADKRLEATLFERRIGEVGPVIETDSAYLIVKINQRDKEEFTPFPDVQAEIKKTLEKQATEQNAQHVIDELYANATITTVFDKETAVTRR